MARRAALTMARTPSAAILHSLNKSPLARSYGLYDGV